MSHSTVRTILGGLALLCACDPDPSAVRERDGYTDDPTCGNWRCGYNAAEFNGRSLQTLHLGDLANADGVRIVGFTPPPLGLLGGYTLAVEGDELVAKGAGPTLRGPGLVGSIILVQIELGLVLPVTILGHSEVQSWAAGAPPVAAYTLVYPEVGALLGLRNVCSGSLLDPVASVATILGGETYDDETKTVNAGMTGWFTIACAGSAAAKMKLMGYGPQSPFPGTTQPASPAARQATLKMITADYCGTGEAYTENGTPLVWRNLAGTVDSSSWHTPGAREAIWSASGAVCLDSTRLPDVQIDCELPSCEGLDEADGEWSTRLALD